MAHATNPVYNELSEPTTQMPVKTLKRLAADAGLRDTRGLEKRELPTAIKRARLETQGIDWRMDVGDLSVIVDTTVEELPRKDRLFHIRTNARSYGCLAHTRLMEATKEEFLTQPVFAKDRKACETLLESEAMAAQADANGRAAPVSCKVADRRVRSFLRHVVPDENNDGSERWKDLGEDEVVCVLAAGARLVFADGLAEYALEPEEGMASERLTVGMFIDAIETVAFDAQQFRHEGGGQVNLTHRFCEMRVTHSKHIKGATIAIFWGS